MEAVLQTPTDEPQRILVPRRWVGAPDRAWNPTVALSLAVVASFLGIAVASQVGSLSPWFAIPGLGLCYYV
ncbi:MAG: hypothetical protein OEP95_16245, partial [Myxococcales bacterium]|nr:hypothetical protein [Myxococcales bacterium]